MNLKKTYWKRSLKLMTLLVTSLVIASVSASTYYGMFISGTINIKTAQVIWVAGTNPNATITPTGDTATVTLSVMSGTAQNFTNCLYLKNQGGKDYTVNFTLTSTPLSTTYFNTAKVLIYDNASLGTLLATLNMTTPTTPANNNVLSAGHAFSLVFDIVTTSSATGPYYFDITVAYK
jgi:hypothetical protein